MDLIMIIIIVAFMLSIIWVFKKNRAEKRKDEEILNKYYEQRRKLKFGGLKTGTKS